MKLSTIPALLLLAALSFHAMAVEAAESQMEEFGLRDEKRAREIEYRAYFPKEGVKLPLIVFSHGFGADRTAFAAILQHWAEHGYVVIAPSHLDGMGKSKGKGDPLPPGGLPALMKNAALKIEHRVRDVTFVFDALEQLEATVPALRGRIDRTEFGVGGHSLGAYTAMRAGGVVTEAGDEKALDLRDPRVRCILPISGQGTGQQGLTRTSWAKLAIPMLTITGSLDRGAGGQGPEWKREPYELSPAGDKYLVFIEGANHVSFGGRADEIGQIVKASTTSFWDAYLKRDEAAKASLQDGSVLKAWKGRASISSK